MVRALSILATAVSLAIVPRIALAADLPLSPPITCANGLIGGINCIPTKSDLKRSREAFERGLKLHKRERLVEAFEQFDEAARLNPQNIDYLRAREGLRARLVFDHIQSGNVLMLQDARLRAAAEFRAAIDLDGDNQFALLRLEEATLVSNPVLN
jgi:tetratricopeptide (TPR) repeat protein